MLTIHAFNPILQLIGACEILYILKRTLKSDLRLNMSYSIYFVCLNSFIFVNLVSCVLLTLYILYIGKVLQRWLRRFPCGLLWAHRSWNLVQSYGTDSWDKRRSVESFSSDVHIFILNLGWGTNPALSSSVGAWSQWALTSSSGSLSLSLLQAMPSQACLSSVPSTVTGQGWGPQWNTN